MNKCMSFAIVFLLFVLVICRIISDFYQFAQKKDPKMAAKLKDIALVADFITAEEEQFSQLSGDQKFDDGLKSLQAIFPDAHLDLLKGALQYSYNHTIKPAKPAEQPKTSQPEPAKAEPAKPVADQPKPVVADPKVQSLLDDLEVK